MKISKKAIIFTGVAVLAFSLMSFASAKVNQAKLVLANLKPKMNFPKRIRIEDGALKFAIDVSLMNPTAEHFTLSSGGTIAVSGFRLKRNNETISTGNLGNLSHIELPKYGNGTIRDIEVALPLVELSGVMVEILTKGGGFLDLVGSVFEKGGLKNLTENAKKVNWQEELKKFAFEVDIQGFGQTHIHQQKFV